MAIADIGLQIRDSNVPQLLLEFDGVQNSTFEVNSIGQLLVTPTGAEELFFGTHFQIVPPLNANANLKLANTGTGVGVIDAGSNALNIRLAAVDQMVISGGGFTVGSTGTLHVEEGSAPDGINFQGATDSPVISIIPSAAGGVPILRMLAEPDINNSDQIRIPQINGTAAQFRKNTVGVPTILLTQWQFSDMPVVIDLALGLSNGTSGAPSLYFTASPDMGLFRFSATSIGFAIAGNIVNDFSSTAAQFRKPVHGDSGLVGAPQFSFYGDPDTGMWNVGADNLGFVAGGVEGVRVQASLVQMMHRTIHPDGVAGFPSVSFSSNPDTGMYLETGDLKFSVAASNRLILFNTLGFGQFINPTGQETLRLQSLEVGNSPFMTFFDTTNTRKGFIQSAGATMLLATDVIGGTIQLNIAGVNHFNLRNNGLQIFHDTASLAIISTGASSHARIDATPTGSGTFILNSGLNSILLSVVGVTIMLLSGGVITNSVQMQAIKGVAGAPGYSFTSLSTTGMYAESNQIRFSNAGVAAFAIGGTQVFAGNGAVLNPTYSFFNDSQTGMRLQTPGDLRFSALGLDICRIVGNALQPSVDSVTQLGGDTLRWSHLYVDNITVTNVPWGTAFPLLAPDGAAAAPSYSFANAATSGMYHETGTGQLRFVSAGSLMLILLSNGIQVLGGSAAVPGISFMNESTSGLFFVDAGTLGMTLSGIERYRWTAGAFLPIANGVPSLGADANRWSTGYFNNLVVTNPPWPLVVVNSVTGIVGVGTVGAGFALDFVVTEVNSIVGDKYLISPTTLTAGLIGLVFYARCEVNGQMTITVFNGHTVGQNVGSRSFNYMIIR